MEDGMKRISLIVIPLVFVMFLVFVQLPTPVAAQGGDKILFVSVRDNARDFYVMNGDGSAVTRITYDGILKWAPRWSPDGSRIAYSAWPEGQSRPAIYIMNSDGSNPTQITSDVSIEGGPTWSPDGSRIAFNLNDDIYVVNTDGSNAVNLTNDTWKDSEPSWSPDGSRIAFISNRNLANNITPVFDVYTINMDGTNVTRVTNAARYIEARQNYRVRSPAWAPDSKRIAYVVESYVSMIYTRKMLFTINADGSEEKNVTGGSTGPHTSPSWSPDGSRIAVVTLGDIHVLNADGSAEATLTDLNADSWPDWWGPAPAQPTPAPQPPSGDARCFAATGFCIDGRIREYWEQNGGLPVFGLPIGPQQVEVIEGRQIQVQWFERNRLELHPENQRPYDVLLGRLGADRLAQLGYDWQALSRETPQSGCRYFEETGRNVCGEILVAWRANGLDLDGRRGFTEGENLALFGLPLTGVITERLSDGREYQVQYFERARFELHPENQPPYNVLLGLLGSEVRGGQ
jgi:Tol biopolymer transport system component